MTVRAAATAGPRLGDRRWPELDGPADVLVLVPVGSLEQHGPGLPLCVDTVVATRVALEAAARRVADGDRVLVAPAVAYGSSGEHQDFPGTVSIGQEALRLVLVELGRSACTWARGVIFVNGHGGNLRPLTSAVATLRDEGRPVAWTACVVPDGDAHAGRTETSLLLAMAPGLVRTDLLAPGETRPVADLMPRLRSEGVRAVSGSGVLGDPTDASPELGRTLLDGLVDRLDAELRALDVDERGRLGVRAGAPA
ncbi:mycofactocin biosynthesis peptidyl-dipeptidase MftE [Nocardioides palaemonis]|uniref:mycofactocin biosynthesis peptidyl-dipeptidase MftE n=1 Tax=Nocardioides palaemonis TaxID=2829810 RepID=UPI0027DCBC09|nr:mycofactocin biosynthesis peptidyl-dipeptidase MftE [Nocardioides palaemonis]